MHTKRIERKNYRSLAQPAGPYVHAVKYNGMIMLSGITAYGTPAQGGSISEQVDAIFCQLSLVAEEEQISMQSLLKVTIFVTSLNEIENLRKALFRNYGAALPASSLVQVSHLFSPDISIEIEAIFAEK
jgi:2-iminobutanoate/2-iminopropanoate deaminase